MSEVSLFGSRLSPFVEKVARALEIKRVDFRLVEPASPRDFSKWNPQTGKMPVLELDGERLYDSTFIVRRIDELRPAPPLLSADPVVAAAQRLLEDWSDESLYWHVMALRWTGDNREATTHQIVDTLPWFLRPVARIVLPRQIGGQTIAQGLGRLPHERTLREFGGRLDDLVTILADEPFFYGETLSVADLAVYGQLNLARSGATPDAAKELEARPVLLELMTRVEAAAAGSGSSRAARP